MTDTDKQRIAHNFGQSAFTYHSHAHLQKCCAQQLLSLLDQCLNHSSHPLPPGPILEIGCGTGFISQLLLERFRGKRSLQITDLSPEMVQFCQEFLGLQLQQTVPSPRAETMIHFRTLDAETRDAPSNTYSLIIGGFVAQWFKEPVLTIRRLLGQLQPGGWLLLSFPGHESFPEWRQWCEQLDLPFTGHPLPNAIALVHHLQLTPRQYTLHTQMWPTYYDNSAAFFRSMKDIGAGFSQTKTRLPLDQMRRLLRAWQPPPASSCEAKPQIMVQYQVVYLAIAKP